LLVTVLFAGCGSSEERRQEETFTTTFVPDAVVPDRDTMFMIENPELGQDRLLAIDIAASNISRGRVVKASFDIEFFGSVIRYEDFTGGDFLGIGEEATYQVTTYSDTPNRISVLITRQVLDSGVTGNGILITLRFRLVGIGSSPIHFANAKVIQSNGESISFIAWFGGTVINA
jgi:hypothetical protein